MGPPAGPDCCRLSWVVEQIFLRSSHSITTGMSGLLSSSPGAQLPTTFTGFPPACDPFSRSLAGKMLSKKAQAEADRQRAQGETVAAAAAAQESRFELARRLTEVSHSAALLHSWDA